MAIKLELLSRIPEKLLHETPILLVHGAWHGAWCWEPHFIPYLTSQGYAVYALSLRGHGNSEGRDGLKWYTVKDYVEDLKTVVDQLPSRPVIVGHSMGGRVVQRYLEQEDGPGGVLMSSPPFGGVAKLVLRLLFTHPLRLLKVNGVFSLYPFVNTPQIAREMLFSSSLPDEELLRYHALLQDEAYLAFLNLLFMGRIRPERTKTPMLVIGGENDNVFDPKGTNRTARAYGQEAVILPDTAHDVMLEKNWQRAADVILDWLKSKGL